MSENTKTLAELKELAIKSAEQVLHRELTDLEKSFVSFAVNTTYSEMTFPK